LQHAIENLGVQGRIDDVAVNRDQDCIAVRRSSCGLPGADIAACARDVLYVELLSQPLRQFLQDEAGAAAVSVFANVASAQSYSTRPVRVIVPFAPGGPTDVGARRLIQKLTAWKPHVALSRRSGYRNASDSERVAPNGRAIFALASTCRDCRPARLS
jgi:hypothetical protein